MRDGIISIDDWRRAPVRVLHLLKEPIADQYARWRRRHSGTGAPDLTEMIRAGGSRLADVWRTCARRGLFVLRAQTGDKTMGTWKASREIKDDAFAVALRQQAVANIKKTLGKSRSEAGELAKHVSKPLIDDIEQARPNYVLCGGTWRLVRGALGVNPTEAANGARWCEHNGIVWVECNHPSVRVGANVDYTWFVAGALDSESGWLRKGR